LRESKKNTTWQFSIQEAINLKIKNRVKSYYYYFFIRVNVKTFRSIIILNIFVSKILRKGQQSLKYFHLVSQTSFNPLRLIKSTVQILSTTTFIFISFLICLYFSYLSIWSKHVRCLCWNKMCLTMNLKEFWW
jgi:hypothetical protein